VRRGWKLILDFCGCPTSYHEMFLAELGHEPKSLVELESPCCRASARTNKVATKRPGQKVMHDVFHASLAEWRSEIKAAQGTIIQIYSETSSAGTS